MTTTTVTLTLTPRDLDEGAGLAFKVAKAVRLATDGHTCLLQGAGAALQFDPDPDTGVAVTTASLLDADWTSRVDRIVQRLITATRSRAT